jgi:hypothetical protein
MISVIDPNGSQRITAPAKPPSAEDLCAWIGVERGYLELVHVLYKGQREQMFVDESAKLRDPPLPYNDLATGIYLAASTGGDPDKVRQAVAGGNFIVGTAVLLTGRHKVD